MLSRLGCGGGLAGSVDRASTSISVCDLREKDKINVCRVNGSDAAPYLFLQTGVEMLDESGSWR